MLIRKTLPIRKFSLKRNFSISLPLRISFESKHGLILLAVEIMKNISLLRFVLTKQIAPVLPSGRLRVLIRPHTGFTLNPILSRILRTPIWIRARLSISSVQIITLSRKRKTQENSLLPLPRKAWVPSSLSRYSPIPS